MAAKSSRKKAENIITAANATTYPCTTANTADPVQNPTQNRKNNTLKHQQLGTRIDKVDHQPGSISSIPTQQQHSKIGDTREVQGTTNLKACKNAERETTIQQQESQKQESHRPPKKNSTQEITRNNNSMLQDSLLVQDSSVSGEHRVETNFEASCTQKPIKNTINVHADTCNSERARIINKFSNRCIVSSDESSIRAVVKCKHWNSHTNFTRKSNTQPHPHSKLKLTRELTVKSRFSHFLLIFHFLKLFSTKL